MNLPFVIKFFKKIELFQDLVAYDKLFKQSLDRSDSHSTLHSWEVEKKILFWSRWGHKHLSSPLVINRFKDEGDLNDLKITKEEAKKAGIREFMRNLVQRGFAKYYNDTEMENQGILLTREGLLMGELIFEIQEIADIERNLNDPYWVKYKEFYQATHCLKKQSLRYNLYWLVIIVGWVVVLLGIMGIVKSVF